MIVMRTFRSPNDVLTARRRKTSFIYTFRRSTLFEHNSLQVSDKPFVNKSLC
ncbi:hypothetical protein [Alphabaculovirus altersperidaniae]|uniref:Uncharacterized protein n=1 Tax=Spodoptera eridania nucleopolyhedrovirus TaxID=2315721 RepID=A0ABX6TQF3_9ABAC|nr:hypothetical protein QKS47_gp110 [Spodoptera eridania nucleopolyhedrovirus]QNV47828.1 hypothetical protein [Spodoptera eridania nucleopolyhedrovirus]